MSFLQINNANPSEKRPFRLSDIQDIWNGIKSLFKAISGEQFRIISGFDLVSGTYTSGTVWYNGELYEYDSSAYPITPSTTRVSFTRISQDDRTLEGGSIQPFSYKYVCGGDTLSGSTTFTYFVANIEKYKSFLGDGSVTTAKLADKSVSYAKLAQNACMQISDIQLAPFASSADNLTLESTFAQGYRARSIELSNSDGLVFIETDTSSSSPLMIYVPIFNGSAGTMRVRFIGFGDSLCEIEIPSSTQQCVTFAKVQAGSMFSYLPISSIVTLNI